MKKFNIEEVFKNFPYEDIQARIDCIEDTIEDLKELQKAIMEDGYWCPTCKKWYYKKDCGTDVEIKEETVCTNPLMGYLDDYQYETRKYTEYFYVCPSAHKVNAPVMFGGFI
jgi:translation initiation factor 2 beta subunit (eIF-2beta)/eIF-5